MYINEDVAMKAFITVVALAVCIYFTVFILRTASEAEKEAKSEIEFIDTNAEEFSFYLDGVEVEYDNISLEQYDMDYDLGSKKVFLSKRAGESFSTLFPVFLPSL